VSEPKQMGVSEPERGEPVGAEVPRPACPLRWTTRKVWQAGLGDGLGAGSPYNCFS
jgi:hypothetical protein